MPLRTLDPSALRTVDVYKLLIGLVVPRPIGWVGTVDAHGRRNLAPYSFFNVVSARPPTVVFSPGRRRDGVKDTYANVTATSQFTLNIVTEEVAEAMNLTSGEYPPEVDEFAVAGLTSRPGQKVSAPLVNEAKAAMECTVTQVVDVGEPPSNSVVFGEIVRIHVDDGLLDGTRVIPEQLKAVGRMAGAGYSRTADALFWMERPDPTPI